MSVVLTKVSFALLYCLCVSLFFLPLEVNNIVLAALMILCVVNTKRKDFINLIKETQLAWLLISFFALQAFGLIYSENIRAGMFSLEKLISFTLMPMVMLPLLKNVRINHNRFFENIGLITVVGSICLLFIALFRFFVLGYERAFYFESFRSFEGFSPVHYVYFSIYFVFGSMIFIEAKFDGWLKKKYGQIALIILLLYCSAIVVLIASKTGILAFILCAVCLLYFKIRNRKAFLVAMSLLLPVTLALLFFNQTTKKRFEGLTNDYVSLFGRELPKKIEFNDLNMRLVFWKLSINNLWIENKIWTGVGTGDAQDYIDSLYKLPEYRIDGYVGWNSHNQWVTTFIQQGLIGLCILSLLFFVPFIKAFREGDVKFILFLITTFCFSLTESIFETNKGIVFSALFFTLFAVSTIKSKVQKNTSF